MQRMSKKRKHELSFYLNDLGRVTYNELCLFIIDGFPQFLFAFLHLPVEPFQL